ncbi:MAG: formylglycine-generating enzyme family protein [Candidatus Hydrogenedentes bacterium]|nr:formylglycine-generating enzyme family protein [Candidatus Hydrogenedentota bacterium]
MNTQRWGVLAVSVLVVVGCTTPGRPHPGRDTARPGQDAGRPGVTERPQGPQHGALERPPVPGEERMFAGMPMVWVPAGTFTMGSPKGEPQRDPEDEVPRTVRIERGFWIGKYEVTQAQWVAVMGHNPSDFTGYRRPVENVSWHECVAFAERLTGEAGVFRLPTEAEWEYACRAGTATPFHFGGAITTDYANYNGQYVYAGGPRGAYREETTQVGSFKPNAWGLYDMHGNVWEWCADRYGATYAASEYPGGGPRVIRGGGWLSEPMSCRSAYSYCFDASNRYNFVGFRIVREATEDAMLDEDGVASYAEAGVARRADDRS